MPCFVDVPEGHVLFWRETEEAAEEVEDSEERRKGKRW